MGEKAGKLLSADKVHKAEGGVMVGKEREEKGKKMGVYGWGQRVGRGEGGGSLYLGLRRGLRGRP